MGIYLQNVVSGAWANFGELISPLAFSKTLKDNIASCTVNIFFEGANASTGLLLPGDFVRLCDSGTFTYEYFVVEDSSKSDSSTIDPFSIHSYKLSELLAYTREVYVQTAFFSNGEYTMPEFFTRLFALSKLDVTLELSTLIDYATALANWQSPDYQVASNSLLDNLFKIGKSLGVRFMATYQPSENTIYLYAHSLKGSEVVTSLGTSKNGSLSQYKASNYASKVVANVENMGTDQFFWVPSLLPIYGSRVEPDEEYASTFTASSMVLKTPHPILDCDFVRVSVFAKVLTDSVTAYPGATYYKFFDNKGNEIVADSGKNTYYKTDNDESYRVDDPDVYFIIPVYEYREWLLLDPDSSGSATWHQQNTLYFKRGENKIYNLGNITAYGATASYKNDPAYVYKTYDSGWNELTSTNLYGAIHFHNSLFIVHAQFQLDGQIENRNYLGGKRTAIYSPQENLVSGKSVSSNMNQYADSMMNADDTLIYEVDTLSACAGLGGIYGGKVIHTINYELAYQSVKVQYELSDDLVPKSEYMSEDTGLSLPSIPLDKAFDRFTNYNITIWLCKSNTPANSAITAHGANTYLSMANAEHFINGVENSRSHVSRTPPNALIRTGDGAGSYVYTAVKCTSAAIGNKLIFSFRSIDNSTIGYFVDKTAGSAPEDFKFYPISFINSTGKCTETYFKLSEHPKWLTEANFPSIASATFDSSTAVLFDIDDTAYHHDPQETMNVNVEVIYKAFDQTTKIFQAFIEECTVLKDTLFTTDPYTRYIEYDGKTVEVDSVTYTVVGNYVSVKLFFTDANAPATGEYPMKLYRTADAGTTKEYMLDMDAVMVNGATDYFYLAFAFTK